MNITEVRIRLKTKEESKIRAIASITLDECFVVHDIKVIEGNDGFFIAMPSRKTPEGEFKDIVHPLNTETREFIKQRILEDYEKARAERQQAQQEEQP
ncbi:MAG TPA: septation regulator SpoVG [Clostridiales bacterium]|nr:septation regulator SpoVG [Clostridiales bacterium]